MMGYGTPQKYWGGWDGSHKQVLDSLLLIGKNVNYIIPQVYIDQMDLIRGEQLYCNGEFTREVDTSVA